MCSVFNSAYQLLIVKLKIADFRENHTKKFFGAILYYSNYLNSPSWQHWNCNAIAVVAVESVRTNRVFNEFPTDSILSLLLVRWHLLLLHYSNSQKHKVCRHKSASIEIQNNT